MNVINITKDNTDYQNATDIYNAEVAGAGKVVLPCMQTAYTTKTANYTILSTVPSGTVYNNIGDNGTMVLTLPAAADFAGKYLGFHILAAQIIQVASAATADRIYLFGTYTADYKLNIAAVVGNYAVLYCDGTYWYCVECNGVNTLVS